METNPSGISILACSSTLYSLEKLIEWKRECMEKRNQNPCFPLYSLEKLIEWKLLPFAAIYQGCL
ncbi:hypothetical protein C789_957 [Microcystis aeruginosa FACHB-905 = DIANCHI905]|uniref:Uncharacterized protein n=1 Tax=Microcystis aeruginosa PCC 7806SL TaxID=1903187 RepID=A0AB33C758_MICA7|nr:hypothetical protein BH695_3769 [Microcystis aeruginosa PCC 7806SL]ELS49246.1 hypothetical protein C789_957 [Microcystis aeruginosa FACHB-905 = DIANCHI905]